MLEVPSLHAINPHAVKLSTFLVRQAVGRELLLAQSMLSSVVCWGCVGGHPAGDDQGPVQYIFRGHWQEDQGRQGQAPLPPLQVHTLIAFRAACKKSDGLCC